MEWLKDQNWKQDKNGEYIKIYYLEKRKSLIMIN